MKYGVLAIVLFCITACSVDPQPITYGKDECAFCSMTIMDARFGSELVTEKGKIFKFDSGECLIRYFKNHTDQTFEYKMVTHIAEPNQLHDASQSSFVVSENIPSPMGGNLSAYPDINSARTTADENGGEVYSWNEILDTYHSN